MKFKKKHSKMMNGKPSRKQIRKEKRIQKKSRKNDYFHRRGKPSPIPGQFVRSPNVKENQNKMAHNIKGGGKPRKSEPVTQNNKQNHLPLSIEQQRNKELKEQKKLETEMAQQRNKQLMLANDIEDRSIKKLEKQLKLNKRKSKGIPKSFAEDGLGYLLEVCDSDNIKSETMAEQQFADFNEDFGEDLELMTGKTPSSKKKNKSHHGEISDDEIFSDDYDSDENSEEDISDMNEEDLDDEDLDDEDMNESEEISDNDTDESDLVASKHKLKKIQTKQTESTKPEQKNSKKLRHEEKNKSEETKVQNNGIKRHTEGNETNSNTKRSRNSDSSGEEDESDPENSEGETDYSSPEEQDVPIKRATKVNPDGTWEDIYGRLHAKDGSLITNDTGKYIPPAVRAKMEEGCSEDKKVLEKRNRLKKQLKGLINRLAAGNMHNISTQIEELYMNNSRNDMNETLTNLILESTVSNISTPERMLMEHVLLIAVLHANVGTEVGAHFLQTVMKQFDQTLISEPPVEDKTLDNIVIIIAQLYNFKLFDSKLMFEILHKLEENFSEKNIDCVLHVLKNVGFNLRKDDPLALKHLILESQKKAAVIAGGLVSGTRVKFLLDIFLAIKNNNMTKIPNYDNSYSEHLKKIMKGFIRKGNYVTQLNITLEDLLKAEEKGKWWVVGSAWTGNISDNKETLKNPNTPNFSQKLLYAAKKQRMNTDTRRNIFCIIMSAEDYLDAFEKLLHLGLTKNQDREIIHVILHCCLQENPYNPYYALLAQKFCDYDRKHQLTIKYSIWDKLKALGEQKTFQVSNLAKLLTHLFLEKGLPISTLKIVEFAELDKLNLRFIRQILLGILLHNDTEACLQVFENVAKSEKLKMFRESLRLFIHHFLLRNFKSENIDAKQRDLLETRSKIIEKLLLRKEKSNFY